MSLSAGSKLSPYEILSPPGAVGIGELYRERDERLRAWGSRSSRLFCCVAVTFLLVQTGAAILQAAEAFTSVHWKQRTEIEVLGSAPQVLESDEIWVKDGKVRMKVRAGDQEMNKLKLHGDIYTWRQGESTGAKIHLQGQDSGGLTFEYVNHVGEYRTKGKQIGSEPLDGHFCDIYEYQEEHKHTKAKFWMATDLHDFPIKAVIDAGDGKLTTYRNTEIEIAAAIPDDMMEVPNDIQFREQPLRVGDKDVKAPVLMSRVEPSYPEAARKARMEGVVTLEAILTAAGTVEDVKILKSVTPLLDASAVRAVQQWRYKPATLEGQPVRVYLTVTVTFSLGRRQNELQSAVLVHRVEPVYPEAARKAGMKGSVGLKVFVSTSGAVEKVRITRSADPLIDDAVVQAVQQWKFRPATLRGSPVAVNLDVTFTFDLR